MTRFQCSDCGGETFRLSGGRLSMTVNAVCDGCSDTVAEFSRMDFTQ